MKGHRNKISKISISGFKSIKDLKDFELNRLNLLIGANGSGKSNFLAFFKLLRKIVDGKLEEYTAESGGADSFVYLGLKNTNEINTSIDFGPNHYSINLSPDQSDKFLIKQEICSFDRDRYQPGTSKILTTANRRESGIRSDRFKDAAIVQSVIASIDSWVLYHFHDTSDTAQVKRTQDIDDNVFLKPDASNLAAYLHLLQERYGANYNQIVAVIKLVAPFFEDFDLKPSELHPGKIRLEWRQRSTDKFFDANSLSDGTLRFICLATLFLQPKEKMPTTIIIDEPELGLHPAAITQLASLMKSVSAHTQIIASTQSVTLLNQFGCEDVIVTEKSNGASSFKRLGKDEVSQWLEDYSLGELWEKNQIGGRP